MIVPSALSLARIHEVDESLVKSDVRSLSLAWSGIVIAAGVVGVALELAIIVLRFLNIGFVNLKINYFLLAVSTN